MIFKKLWTVFENMDDDQEFCLEVAAAVPSLRPLLETHRIENDDQILPYVFFWDVALWAEDHAFTEVDAVKSLIRELTKGLESESFELRNLVTVGFLETLLTDTALIPLLTPVLRARLIEIGRRLP